MAEVKWSLWKRFLLWVYSHDWRTFKSDPAFDPVAFQNNVQYLLPNMRPEHARGWYWLSIRDLWFPRPDGECHKPIWWLERNHERVSR